MSNSRNTTLKRKWVIEEQEIETQTAPMNAVQVGNSTSQVFQALAGPSSTVLSFEDAKRIVSARAGKYAPAKMAILTEKLHDRDIPLTTEIINQAMTNAYDLRAFCERIQTLHREGVELTDTVVKSISSLYGATITDILQNLHYRGIVLVENIVKNLTLAAHLAIEREYVVALLLLDYSKFLHYDSVQAVSGFVRDPWMDASDMIKRFRKPSIDSEI